jgi:hypothetical protein
MDDGKNDDFLFQHTVEQAVGESSNNGAPNLAVDTRVSQWEF